MVRKRGLKWVIDLRWSFPDGRRERIRRAAPGRTRREAEEYERQLITALNTGKYEPHGCADKPKEGIPTLKDWRDELVAHAKRHNRQSTVEWKTQTLDKWIIPAFGALPLDQIRPRQVETAKLQWLEEIEPATVNRNLAVLSWALRLAVELELIPSTPRIRKLQENPKKKSWLTVDEAVVFIAALPAKWRVMATVAVQTGMRLGELRALKLGDIDSEHGVIHVRAAIVRGVEGLPKSGKPRWIPMTKAVQKALKEHPRHLKSEYLFYDEKGKPVGKDSARYAFESACRKTGITDVGWHALRHSFASQLSTAGVPVAQIQQLCGHSDVRTTMVYTHVRDSELSAAVQAIELSPTESGHHLVTNAQNA